MAREGILDRRKKFVLTPQTFAALFLVVSLSAVFYALMHKIHDEGVAHPALLMLLPLPTILWLVLIIPLFIFMAYQADFKGLNPLIPTHYVLIAKRCFKAMKDNDFKVSEKDL
ncbi:hypothetical protein Vretimale_9415 [Volvox reticuliferus]|uniref:Uncharacterized protein n=1 Tax=Volvox reticuliferus TaxID=1737510 RepID=A0A8J4GCS6_9CHLO|nr:hypothetical protein Vretifemale_9876 [Volvox reticuliferus]GIM04969.1 hypothetical protein Vretimale_9415 [Volvox reticuliferus]